MNTVSLIVSSHRSSCRCSFPHYFILIWSVSAGMDGLTLLTYLKSATYGSKMTLRWQVIIQQVDALMLHGLLRQPSDDCLESMLCSWHGLTYFPAFFIALICCFAVLSSLIRSINTASMKRGNVSFYQKKNVLMLYEYITDSMVEAVSLSSRKLCSKRKSCHQQKQKN